MKLVIARADCSRIKELVITLEMRWQNRLAGRDTSGCVAIFVGNPPVVGRCLPWLLAFVAPIAATLIA